MANTIQIDIVANDKTGDALANLGSKLTTLGLGLDKLTDPLMDLWKKLFKTDEMEAALAPIKEAFQGVFVELVATLGPIIANLTPLLLGLAETLSGLVKWFSELDPTIQMVIVGILALITVIGPILIVIGTLMTAFSAIIPIITAAAAALGLPVVAFIAIIAAIGALIVALVAFWPQISAWAQNVMNKFVEIKDKVVEAVTNAYDSIVEQVGNWFTAGKDLIGGLVDGVVDAADDLLDSVVKAVEDAYNAALAFLGIKSPSKLFADVGKNVMLGMTEGINKMAVSPQLAIQNAAGGMVASAIPSGGRGTGAGNTIVVNYSPVVSLADRYEAETKLVPYIESALRKIR